MVDNNVELNHVFLGSGISMGIVIAKSGFMALDLVLLYPQHDDEAMINAGPESSLTTIL